jgi:hypothetical protein
MAERSKINHGHVLAAMMLAGVRARYVAFGILHLIHAHAGASFNIGPPTCR